MNLDTAHIGGDETAEVHILTPVEQKYSINNECNIIKCSTKKQKKN